MFYPSETVNDRESTFSSCCFVYTKRVHVHIYVFVCVIFSRCCCSGNILLSIQSVVLVVVSVLKKCSYKNKWKSKTHFDINQSSMLYSHFTYIIDGRNTNVHTHTWAVKWCTINKKHCVTQQRPNKIASMHLCAIWAQIKYNQKLLQTTNGSDLLLHAIKWLNAICYRILNNLFFSPSSRCICFFLV